MLEHRMIVAVAVSAGLLISVVLLAVYVFDIGHSRSNSRQSTPTISRAQNRDDSGVLAAIPGWTDFASSSPNRCVNLEVTFSHDKRFAEVEPVRSTCPDLGYGGKSGRRFSSSTGETLDRGVYGLGRATVLAGNTEGACGLLRRRIDEVGRLESKSPAGSAGA